MELTDTVTRPTEPPGRQPLSAELPQSSFPHEFLTPVRISGTEHMHHRGTFLQLGRGTNHSIVGIVAAEIHTATAILWGRSQKSFAILSTALGLVSDSENNPALGTLGASRAEVALAMVGLGTGVSSRQEDKCQ